MCNMLALKLLQNRNQCFKLFLVKFTFCCFLNCRNFVLLSDDCVTVYVELVILICDNDSWIFCIGTIKSFNFELDLYSVRVLISLLYEFFSSDNRIRTSVLFVRSAIFAKLYVSSSSEPSWNNIASSLVSVWHNSELCSNRIESISNTSFVEIALHIVFFGNVFNSKSWAICFVTVKYSTIQLVFLFAKQYSISVE